MRDISEEDEEGEVDSELDAELGALRCDTPCSHLISCTEASDDSEDEDIEEDQEGLPPALGKGERNSQLTVGYKGDRSYVVRGNNIGVFNHGADNGVRYNATISKLTTPQGKEFIPKQVRNLESR